MIALDYFLHGLADAIAGGHAGPPAAARILNIAGESAFVVAFFLFALSPLFLFPTGRLPSRRWRWPTGAGIVGCGVAVISVLLAPGPVDEDVPAWGDNPIGLDAAPRFIDALELIGLGLLAVGIVLGLAAFVTRWVRYRGARRQQMAWFTIGVVVHTAGLSTDTCGRLGHGRGPDGAGDLRHHALRHRLAAARTPRRTGRGTWPGHTYARGAGVALVGSSSSHPRAVRRSVSSFLEEAHASGPLHAGQLTELDGGTAMKCAHKEIDT